MLPELKLKSIRPKATEDEKGAGCYGIEQALFILCIENFTWPSVIASFHSGRAFTYEQASI